MLEVVFVALFAAVFGAALLVLGYRMFLVLLPVFGFFAGLWLGAHAVTLIFGTGFLSTVTSWIAGIGLGLLFAILAYLFYLLAIVLISAVIGYGLGSGVMVAIGLNPGLITALVGIVCAVVVIGLVLLLNLQKYVVIGLTVIVGANAVILAVLLLFGQVSLSNLTTAGEAISPVLHASLFWTIVWVIMAGLGVWAQLHTGRDYEFTSADYQEGWG